VIYPSTTPGLPVIPECSLNVPGMVFRGSNHDPGCFLKNELFRQLFDLK